MQCLVLGFCHLYKFALMYYKTHLFIVSYSASVSDRLPTQCWSNISSGSSGVLLVRMSYCLEWHDNSTAASEPSSYSHMSCPCSIPNWKTQNSSWPYDCTVWRHILHYSKNCQEACEVGRIWRHENCCPEGPWFHWQVTVLSFSTV